MNPIRNVRKIPVAIKRATIAGSALGVFQTRSAANETTAFNSSIGTPDSYLIDLKVDLATGHYPHIGGAVQIIALFDPTLWLAVHAIRSWIIVTWGNAVI